MVGSLCCRSPRSSACTLAAPPQQPSCLLEWNPFANEEPVGTPGWWKKHKKKAVFESDKGYRSKASTATSTTTAGRSRARSPPSESSKPAKRTDEIGLIPGLDPRVQYGKVKEAVGLGPERAVRPRMRTSKAIACSARKNTTRRPRSSRGDRARAAFADRAGRHVHARRELLLRRPLHQGPRRLRRARQGVSQHAVHGHADRPRVEDRPVLGEATRTTAPTGR